MVKIKSNLDDFYEELKDLHKTSFPNWEFGKFISNFFDRLIVREKISPFFQSNEEILKELKKFCCITNENEEDMNTFKIRLTTFQDVMLFNHECWKFTECISYTIGSVTVDAKCLNDLSQMSLDKVATVSINTEDKRLIDEFISHISRWLVGDQ